MDEATKTRREVEEMMNDESSRCDYDECETKDEACIYYRVEREDMGMKYYEILLLCIACMKIELNYSAS